MFAWTALSEMRNMFTKAGAVLRRASGIQKFFCDSLMISVVKESNEILPL